MTTRVRIVAGFGSVADERPTIDTAMALARALEADVAGYFVEDTDLLNLAALPFAKAMRPTDRSVLTVKLSQMEKEMARAAVNWRRALYASAGQARIRCSFETIRGAYSAEIARAGAATDVVIFNPANLPHRRPDSVSALLQRFEQAAGAVILPEQRPHRRGPVVLVATGAPGESGLFETTERIARATGRDAVVLSVAGEEDADQRISDLAHMVFGSGIEIFRAPGGTLSAGAALLSQLEPSFIVLRQPEPAAIVDVFLKAGQAPMLLMRGQDD